jgi:hypothetical protein
MYFNELVIDMKKITQLIFFISSVNFVWGSEYNSETNMVSPSINNIVCETNLDCGLSDSIKSDNDRNEFRKGTIIISAGYGFGNLTKVLFTPYESFDAFTYKIFGPIHFKGEYGISDKIGLGLSINYFSGNATWNETYDQSSGQLTPPGRWNFSSASILVRLNIHFVTLKHLDIYWGAGLGYRQAIWNFSSTWPLVTPAPKYFSTPRFVPFGLETTLGLRYYLTKYIGVYTEFGFAKALIQGGIVVKF